MFSDNICLHHGLKLMPTIGQMYLEAFQLGIRQLMYHRFRVSQTHTFLALVDANPVLVVVGRDVLQDGIVLGNVLHVDELLF